MEATAANTDGKPVHSSTMAKISQTWLASHTGPIECSIRSAGGRPRLAAAGDQVPEPAAEVGAAEQHVSGQAEPQHGEHELGERHVSSRTWYPVTSASCGATGTGVSAGQPAQHVHRGHRQHRVHGGDQHEPPDAARARG